MSEETREGWSTTRWEVEVLTKRGEIRMYKFPNAKAAWSFSKHPRNGWKVGKPRERTIDNSGVHYKRAVKV